MNLNSPQLFFSEYSKLNKGETPNSPTFGSLSTSFGFSPSPPKIQVSNEGEPSQDNDVIYYTVKPNDTLAGIAISFGMKQEHIKQINQLHSDKLIPGEVIESLYY
jgi:LysM repeat protein